MGFGGGKTVVVSSTLYNMAGPEDDRPNFIKGTLFGSIISDSPSLADDIQTSLFQGPGMRQRQFFRYADRNNIPGMVDTTIVNDVKLDTLVVAGEIPPSAVPPAPAGLTINVFNTEVSNGEFEVWIHKWILENYPTRIVESWLGEYDPITDMFSVEFPNSDFFTWANDGTFGPVYSSGKRYVWAKYIEFLSSAESTVETGTPTTDVLTLPSLTGFTEQSSTGTFTPVTLQRTRTTVWSYSNGDPDVLFEDAVDADVSDELNTSVDVWEREVVISKNGIEMQGERQIWNLTGTDTVVTGYVNVVVTNTDLGGGVIRTETSTTTGEEVLPSWTTRYDTQDLFIGQQYGPEQVFIYEVGTGNSTLDALVLDTDASGFQEFYPFMPIRINNVSITEPEFEDAYIATKAAYRKAYQGKNFNKLVDLVEDNESIDDIDYAYLCFGVSLNVKEMACRKYVYNFMEKMLPFQQSGSGDQIGGLATDIAAYNIALNDLRAWELLVASADEWTDIPPRPVLPVINSPATNSIQLKDTTFGFDYRLSWVHIEVDQFTGTFDLDPDLAGYQAPKVDDLLISSGPTTTWQVRDNYNKEPDQPEVLITHELPSMYIYWQISENSYRRMQVWGFVSKNFIYKGKAVTITSKEALEDPESSGFLVPLHYPTFSEMSIVDYTQMATANAHIMFNSYEVTKQKWYEGFIFKILIVVLIIVLAVVMFPTVFAGGGGILGGNLAVGTSLGLTGTAALVAGVVANYIASIIIGQVLQYIGTALFGEKWGALFAAIAGFAIGSVLGGTKLFSAEGILGLGNALANGYSGWVQADILEQQGKLEDDRSEYEKRMEEIQDLINGLGGNDLNFNPLFLTNYGRGNGQGGSKGYLPETADEYIRRTTMTGSDIVELTHSMVYDYVDVAKTLPRN